MNPYRLARAQAYAAQVRRRLVPIVNRSRPPVSVPEFLKAKH